MDRLVDKELERVRQGLIKEAQAPRRSYMRDFLGGVDPTGGATFQYGMQDVETGRRRTGLRRAVGTAGGLAGGAVAVPAGVSGLIGAVKGFSRGKGGLRGRLAGAGRGFLSGAASPFRKVYRAARAKGALKAVGAGKTLTGKQGKALHTFATKEIPGGHLLKGVSPAQAGRAASRLPPEMLAKAREGVSSRLGTGLATLGTSGAIGGGSAYLQYGKGRGAAQRYQQQPAAKTASAHIEKTAGVLSYLAKRLLMRPGRTIILAHGGKGRVERGLRRHRETLRALRESTPAGWVPLGMRARR